jgi:Spy/CpxP family protein refolding chaperone
MKTPIKIISLLALAALAGAPVVRAADEPAAPAPASRQHDRGQRMLEHRLQRLDGQLKLTDAQKTQITTIWKQSAEQGRALRKDDSLTRAERRDKMEAILKTAHDQVRAVLTPDQQKIFDTLPPERRGRRRASRPAPAPGDANP